MVATLSQLHGQVVQARAIQGLAFVFVEKLDVAFIQGAVVLLLRQGEFHLNDGFLFGRDTLFDVLLETSKNIGSNLVVKLVDGFLVFHVTVLGEEIIQITVGFLVTKVEESPELGNIVLNRRAREENFV